MATFKNFMENNIGYIIAVVALFISLMTLFTFLGVDFNPHGKEHIEKIVTIESMLNPLDDNEEATVQPTPSITEKTENNPKPVQLWTIPNISNFIILVKLIYIKQYI